VSKRIVALGFVAAFSIGSFLTLANRSSPVRTIRQRSNPTTSNPNASRRPISGDTSLDAVLEIPGVLNVTSCANVQITRDSTHLYGAYGSDGVHQVWVHVDDVINPTADEPGFDEPRVDKPGVDDSSSAAIGPATDIGSAHRDESSFLRVTTLVTGGLPSDRIPIAKEILASSQLQQTYDPKSLLVHWPSRFRNVESGIPSTVRGEVSSLLEIAYEDSDQTLGDGTVVEGTEETVLLDESFENLRLTWNYGDHLSGPIISWRSGIWFESSKSPADIQAAEVVRGNNMVTLAFAKSGSTHQYAVDLANKVREANVRCPVTTPEDDKAFQSRLAGPAWVMYGDPAKSNESCLTNVRVETTSATVSNYETRCGFPITGVSTLVSTDVPRVYRSIRGTQEKVISTIVSAQVHRIRVKDSVTTHEFAVGLGHTLQPSGVGVVIRPPIAFNSDPLLLEAIDRDQHVIDRVALHLDCPHTAPCSPVNQLLITNTPQDLTPSATLQTNLSLGTVSAPSVSWPEHHQSSLGPPEWAKMSPSLCAVVDLQTRIGDRSDTSANADRDGTYVCIPVSEVTSTTLKVRVATLDYVGAIQQTIGVVGANITAVRVTVYRPITSTMIIPAIRTSPGPGAFTFENLGDYEGAFDVLYEGLDAEQNVVSTWSNTANPRR
jgi:hypothetical protein